MLLIDWWNELKYRYNNTSEFNWETAFWVVMALIAICFIIGGIVVAILWPLIFVWAINYMFGTTIPMTFLTWLAVVIIATVCNSLFGGSLFKVTIKR
jgi:fatty acid desaturase